ncbi:MAG: diguanylate cyclase [Actinomycetota bacterium]
MFRRLRLDRRLRSPRTVYLLASLALLIVLQLVATTVSSLSARDDSLAVARAAIVRETDARVGSILRYLEPAEFSVGVSARLFESDLLQPDDLVVERYLHSQLAVMPQAAGAFVGLPSGEFVFVNRDGEGFSSKRITIEEGVRTVESQRLDAAFELLATEELLDDTYDPRERPWYRTAMDVESVAWTDPYVFFTTGKPGVTASHAVRDSSGLVTAVVGIDVELDGLATLLENLGIAASGEAFVVSGDRVVAAPTSFGDQSTTDENGELRLLTLDEVGVPPPEVDGETVQTTTVDGRRELVMHQMLPSDRGVEWSVVVRAPESEFTDVVDDQRRSLWWMTLGGGTVVLLGAFLLVWVTRPINRLQTEASTDPLTGLANRRALDDLVAELRRSAADGELVSVLALDLDGFKQLNDRFGHHRGDRALELVGERLLATVRTGDVVGRLGGDEFVVVQLVTTVDQATESARRILAAVAEELHERMPDAAVGASGGLTVSSDEVARFDDLLREADAALITAKRDARGLVQLSERLVDSALAGN